MLSTAVTTDTAAAITSLTGRRAEVASRRSKVGGRASQRLTIDQAPSPVVLGPVPRWSPAAALNRRVVFERASESGDQRFSLLR